MKALDLLPGNPHGAFLVKRIPLGCQFTALDQAVDQSSGNLQNLCRLRNRDILTLSHTASIPHIGGIGYTVDNLDNTHNTGYNVDIIDTPGAGVRMDNSKRCSRCQSVKALSEFGKDRKTRDGLNCYCKSCCRELNARYRNNPSTHARLLKAKLDWYYHNQERAYKNTRKWQLANPEKVKLQRQRANEKPENQVKSRQRAALYYRTHTKECKERARRWEQANAERARLLHRQWTEGNRERSRELHRVSERLHPETKQAAKARRRAREKHVAYEDIDRKYVVSRDRSICHICGKRVEPEHISLDHLIPIAEGGPHTTANVRTAHRQCNSRRGAGRLPAQLLLFG